MFRKFYADLQRFKEERGLSKEGFRKLIKRAELWHNPRNWSDAGQELKETLGVDILFDEALKKSGIPRRFYFYFKDVNCHSYRELHKAFTTCRNFSKYSKVWQENAPADISDEIVYISALMSMTYRGMKNEAEEIKRRGLRPSTGDEDYRLGIDAWDADGNPVQIKSPATMRGWK